jgi:polar amino acid transport system ATP-binding protein
METQSNPQSAPAGEAGKTPVEAAKTVIELRKVNKWYGQFQALKEVSLTVHKGERVVICGPSGSGKSTVIRCINRLEQHQEGEILVEGVALTSAVKNIELIRREVGMVFQQFNLFPHLTVAENVMLAQTVVNKTAKKEARDVAAEMLSKVGLSEKMDAWPSQLSGGQQQRVAIARSLAMRPKVLLCDEITSALDPELVNEVLRVVEQLAKEGMTLILVTHEMRFARDVGTNLVFMHHGKVHETGNPKDVFAGPKTPELQQFVAGTGH